MAYTLSPNLGLRLDSNLTANSRFNLRVLDQQASATTVDLNGNLLLRSRNGVFFTANDAAVQGSGTGGMVQFGYQAQPLASFQVYASQLTLSGTLVLADAAPTAFPLALSYKSNAGGAAATAARTLTLDLRDASRTLVLGGDLTVAGGATTLTSAGPSSVQLPSVGTLATLAGAETLTSKFMSGAANTFSLIPYTALVLTGHLVNADVAASAALAYSKLNLTASLVDTDVAASAAIAYSKLALTGHVANSDIAAGAGISGSKVTPAFGAQQVSTSGGFLLQNTGAVTLLAAGTGAPWVLTLPPNPGLTGQVLTTDGTGTSVWAPSAAGGTVSSVSLTAPASVFSVSGSPITSSGTLALTLATQAANRVWAGPSSGGAATPTFRALVNADLGSILIDLTSQVTGTLPVANGGTGVTSSTGTGSVVLNTSPTLVTPALGTPASGVATNLTGLPLTTGVTGTLPVGSGGTGVTSSTGTGSVVLSTSPTLVTPALGTPASAVLTNATGLPLATGVTGTLGLGNGGTGQVTAAAAFNALSPLTTAGDLLYGGASGAGTRLPAGSSTQLLHGGTTPSWSAVSLTADVSGILPVSHGGSGTGTALTQGSVVFAGASGVLSQDNANFFWDATNRRLGLGIASPQFTIDIDPVTEAGINVQTPDFIPFIQSTSTHGGVVALIARRGVDLRLNNGGQDWLQFLDNSPTDNTVQLLGRNSRHLLLGADGTGAAAFGVISRASSGQTALLHDFQTSASASVASVDTSGNIISSTLTASTALIANGSKQLASSSTTSAELAFVHGVTSAIQTQLNGKQASGSYITALTGDVTASGPGSAAASLVATSNATLTTLSALVSAAALTTVGTIGTGTWAGTTVAVNHGGTGTTTSTGTGSVVLSTSPTLVTPALGTPSAAVLTNATGLPLATGVTGTLPAANLPSFKTVWITADGTSKTVTHNLGSLDVIVQLFDQTDGKTIEVDAVQRTTSNAIALSASVAPGAAGWRVLILSV